MTTEDKAQLFDAILYYNNDQPIWELSYVVKVVFSKMKNFFDEQNQKYEEKIVKRNKENGAKWGRPPSKKPQDTTVKTNFYQRKRCNQKLSPSKNSSSFSILGMMLELII